MFATRFSIGWRAPRSARSYVPQTVARAPANALFSMNAMDAGANPHFAARFTPDKEAV